MYTNYPSTRSDFRCALCRQKNIFHCEHDTPYRDQYLGMYDSYMPRNAGIKNPRSKSEMKNTNNDGMNTKREVHSSNGNNQYQQNTKYENQSSKINEQNKQSKSCIIL